MKRHAGSVRSDVDDLFEEEKAPGQSSIDGDKARIIQLRQEIYRLSKSVASRERCALASNGVSVPLSPFLSAADAANLSAIQQQFTQSYLRERRAGRVAGKPKTGTVDFWDAEKRDDPRLTSITVHMPLRPIRNTPQWTVPASNATSVELDLVISSQENEIPMQNIMLPKRVPDLTIRVGLWYLADKGRLANLHIPPTVETLTLDDVAFSLAANELSDERHNNMPRIPVTVQHLRLRNLYRLVNTSLVGDEDVAMPVIRAKRMTMEIAASREGEVLLFPPSVTELRIGHVDLEEVEREYWVPANISERECVIVWPPNLKSLRLTTNLNFSVPAGAPTFPPTLTRLILSKEYLESVYYHESGRDMLHDISELKELRELVFEGIVHIDDFHPMEHYTDFNHYLKDRPFGSIIWPPKLKTLQFSAHQTKEYGNLSLAGLPVNVAEFVFVGKKRIRVPSLEELQKEFDRGRIVSGGPHEEKKKQPNYIDLLARIRGVSSGVDYTSDVVKCGMHADNYSLGAGACIALQDVTAFKAGDLPYTIRLKRNDQEILYVEIHKTAAGGSVYMSADVGTSYDAGIQDLAAVVIEVFKAAIGCGI